MNKKLLDIKDVITTWQGVNLITDNTVAKGSNNDLQILHRKSNSFVVYNKSTVWFYAL